MRLQPVHYITIASLCVLQATLVFFRNTWTGVSYYRLVRIHTQINMECVMLIGSYYIWRKVTSALSFLETDKVRPARQRWRTICAQDVLRAVLLLFLALSHFSFLSYYIYNGDEPNLFAMISLTCVAAYIHVFLFILMTELLYYICLGLLKLNVYPSLTRYITESRKTYTLLSVFCAFLFIIGGLYSTLRDPVYTRELIPMRKFDVTASDMKIVLLSDIHIGPTVGESRLKKIADMTNKLKPDIIAISGDLADGFVRDYKQAASPLCTLKAKYGIYFATGNHEYMHGNVEEWFNFLKECNITVLHNANARIEVDKNTTICMAGMDDLFAARAHFPGHKMDARAALHDCKQSDTVIALAHQPNAAKLILQDPEVQHKVDLILSGHTHGGQMYLFVPIIHFANAFARGLYYDRSTGAYVYVSAGVNYFGPPVKMFNGCEIIDITLTRLDNFRV